MEDYEDWAINNEGELMAEFIKEKKLDTEFELWTTLEYASMGADEADYRRDR